jgi:hypothetical protein
MTDPPQAIRAGEGLVDLTGTAHVAEQSFISPITEQECVAYRLRKEA